MNNSSDHSRSSDACVAPRHSRESFASAYRRFALIATRASLLRVSLCACLVLTSVAATRPAPPPPAVEQGRDGTLVYAASDKGDRVIDFSNCGYMGADEEISNVPVRIVVPLTDGDSTQRIQRALDEVAKLPPDERGIRGAVLLEKGRYEVNGGLRIRASGVVLRGSGAG